MKQDMNLGSDLKMSQVPFSKLVGVIMDVSLARETPLKCYF